MILILPIIVLLAVALFWRKARVILLALAVILASGEVYYLIYKEEASLQQWYVNKEVVEQYLKEKYPGDDWVLMQEGRPAILSGTVQAVFIDEPEVSYLYLVKDEEVVLAGYSTKGEEQEVKRNE